MNKNKILKLIHQYMFIFLGIVLYDIGFYFFLSPAKIVTGGMSGLAIILEPYLQQIGSWFTTSIFLYIVNGICLILGLIFIGKGGGSTHLSAWNSPPEYVTATQ